MHQINVILIIALALAACNNDSHSSPNLDTTQAVKIANSWAIPKKSFQFNSVLTATSDTLVLVTCSEYVYSPFGQLSNKSKLNSGLLQNFSIVNRIDTSSKENFEFQILKLKSSRLILFFDTNVESSRLSYILKGDIVDSDINLLDNIKVGISKTKFFESFFKEFPNEVAKKYNVIAFESCVYGIRHTYTFKDEKLQSINFMTDSYLKVAY